MVLKMVQIETLELETYFCRLAQDLCSTPVLYTVNNIEYPLTCVNYECRLGAVMAPV